MDRNEFGFISAKMESDFRVFTGQGECDGRESVSDTMEMRTRKDSLADSLSLSLSESDWRSVRANRRPGNSLQITAVERVSQ